MKFDPPIFHPNGEFEAATSSCNMFTEQFTSLPGIVYPDGTVCISILHAPGDDPNSELKDQAPAFETLT